VHNKSVNIILLVMAAALIFACATTKKIKDDIMGPDRVLKKKIVFLPTVNNTPFGGKDLEAAASLRLKIALAANCDGLIISDSGKVRQAFSEIPRLPSGQIDPLVLAQKGRVHGVNAVLEQIIMVVEFGTEKRGIWGFRKDTPLLRAVFRVRIYDIETTAVYLDEVFRREVELSEGPQPLEGNVANRYYEQYGQTLLNSIIPTISNHVCGRMREMPWSGFVVDSTKDTYILSVGRDAGLAEGDVLEVFDMGEPLEGYGDRVYLVVGPKMGEIRVTEVKDSQTEAVSISGDGFEKSCCVRLKP
jgi:hypothetical protein